jgi:[ribosomal protein S5]-alanine N-acetyltransferase
MTEAHPARWRWLRRRLADPPCCGEQGRAGRGSAGSSEDQLGEGGDVSTLVTPRLLLLPLSRFMIATRLANAAFSLSCEMSGGVASVHFGPEWPGDVVAQFPDFLRHLGDAAFVEDTFVVVERATGEAVGHVGTMGSAGDHGRFEIGYAVNVSCRGQGYAGEAVGAVTRHLLAGDRVTCVTARTAEGNISSRRVLEANGFQEAQGSPDEDGLISWVRQGDVTNVL